MKLKQDSGFDLFFWLVELTLIVIAAVLLSGLYARAHDALPTAAKPNGWSYPTYCCSGVDCREVGDSRSSAKIRIYETPLGYRVSSTGEVVAYSDYRIKNSPDGVYHWCSVAGADDTRTICLFVPPRGF
jgi:hypothetical protein